MKKSIFKIILVSFVGFFIQSTFSCFSIADESKSNEYPREVHDLKVMDEALFCSSLLQATHEDAHLRSQALKPTDEDEIAEKLAAFSIISNLHTQSKLDPAELIRLRSQKNKRTNNGADYKEGSVLISGSANEYEDSEHILSDLFLDFSAGTNLTYYRQFTLEGNAEIQVFLLLLQNSIEKINHKARRKMIYIRNFEVALMGYIMAVTGFAPSVLGPILNKYVIAGMETGLSALVAILAINTYKKFFKSSGTRVFYPPTLKNLPDMSKNYIGFLEQTKKFLLNPEENKFIIFAVKYFFSTSENSMEYLGKLNLILTYDEDLNPKLSMYHCIFPYYRSAK